MEQPERDMVVLALGRLEGQFGEMKSRLDSMDRRITRHEDQIATSIEAINTKLDDLRDRFGANARDMARARGWVDVLREIPGGLYALIAVALAVAGIALRTRGGGP